MLDTRPNVIRLLMALVCVSFSFTPVAFAAAKHAAAPAAKTAAKKPAPAAKVTAKAAAQGSSTKIASKPSSKGVTKTPSKMVAKAATKPAPQAKAGKKVELATRGKSPATGKSKTDDRRGRHADEKVARRGHETGRRGRERIAARDRRSHGRTRRHERVVDADEPSSAPSDDVAEEAPAEPAEHAADEARQPAANEEFDAPTAHAEPDVAAPAHTETVAAAPAGDGVVDQHVELRQGDTLTSVLTAHGVSADEAQHWAQVAEGAYDLRRFYPHRGLTLRFDRDSRALERVLYQIDDKGKLVLEQTAEGIQARQQGLPYYIEVRGTASKISHTLRDDAARVGVPDRIVTTLAEVFGWEADAETDTPGTDEFRVLYENIWRAGYAYPETGKMLAAQLVRNGQSSGVVYFEDADGKGGYYRPTGEAVTRAFLRYPVEFTEITSGFGWRYHPILHVGRPHKGVDFAAPTGTEVHAASDGRVVKAGWSRGFGRCVKIEHLEGYVSTYGHLSGIVDGVSEGSIVERGQVIGYVGSTGLATGPHLHYEVERWGEAVDPLEMTAMPEQPVQDYSRTAFDKARTNTAKQMAVLPVDESTRILAGTAVAAPSAAYEAE